MKSILPTICVLASLVFIATAGESQEHHRLFYIERNVGPAIVCYDAVTQDGKLLEEDPIDVYWTHPEKGNEREELNWIERWKGYGIDVVRRFGGRDSCDIVMRANKKPVRVVQRNGKWMALTYVDGKVCEVIKIYIAAEEGAALPRILYMTVTGRVRWSGEIVTETVKPD